MNAFSLKKIYYEAQESSLCGRHCLNNILQEPFFETENLLEIAEDLHEQENKLLEDKEEENFNGSERDGFFSLSVLEVALALVDLTLERPMSGMNLTDQQCFIVNTHAHWYSLRKIHNTWLNMNSISLVPGRKGEPMKLSDEDLQLKIASLLSENHDVFVVRGNIPEKPDEQTLQGMGELKNMYSIKSESYYQRLLQLEQERTQKQIERAKMMHERDLQRAMQESLKDCYLGKKDEEPVEKQEGEQKQQDEESKYEEVKKKAEEKPSYKKVAVQPASDLKSGLQSTFAVKHDLDPLGSLKKDAFSTLSQIVKKRLQNEEEELQKAMRLSLQTAREEERRWGSVISKADEPEEAPRIPARSATKSSSTKPSCTTQVKSQAGHHRRRSSYYDQIKVHKDPFMMVKFNLIPVPKNSHHPTFEKFPLKTATVSDVYRRAQENHGTCVLTRGEDVLDPNCDKKLSDMFPHQKWCIFGLKRT